MKEYALYTFYTCGFNTCFALCYTPQSFHQFCIYTQWYTQRTKLQIQGSSTQISIIPALQFLVCSLECMHAHLSCSFDLLFTPSRSRVMSGLSHLPNTEDRVTHRRQTQSNTQETDTQSDTQETDTQSDTQKTDTQSDTQETDTQSDTQGRHTYCTCKHTQKEH